MIFDKSLNKLLISTLKVAFIFILWSYLLGGILNFRYFELIPLSVIGLLFIVISITFLSKNYFQVDAYSCKILSLIFLHFILVTSTSIYGQFFYFPSVIYELYKLYLCMFFVVFLLIGSKSNWVLFIYNSLSLFMIANLIILVLQHIFGVDIINSLGIKYDVSFYASRGRPTGLTLNANVIGSVSLLFYIFIHNLSIASIKYSGYFCRENIKFRGILLIKIVTVMCIALSSSKASLLCLIGFLFFHKVSFKNISILASLFFLSISIIYYNDVYSLQQKIDNYQSYILFFFDDVESLDIRFIEGRIFYWLHAINIFIHNWSGLGFGTWGDFSSSFNPYVKSISAYNDSSDSAFSHYLAEQGIFVFLYISILYFSFKGSGEKVGVFIVILILLFVTNSGFSQPMFYIGFWINGLLFYYLKDVRKNNII